MGCLHLNGLINAFRPTRCDTTVTNCCRRSGLYNVQPLHDGAAVNIDTTSGEVVALKDELPRHPQLSGSASAP